MLILRAGVRVAEADELEERRKKQCKEEQAKNKKTELVLARCTTMPT